MVDSIKCIRASKKDNWHAEFSIKRIRSFAKHLFCFHFCLFALAYLLLCLVSGYYISIKVQMPLDSRLLNKPKLAEIKTLIPYVYMCLGYYWAQRLVIWPLSLDIIASPTFNLFMYNKERISWNKGRMPLQKTTCRLFFSILHKYYLLVSYSS